MANKDYTIPFNDLTNLVPQELRNPMIVSLVDNLFNRFFTKDEAVPLYGYIGKKPSSVDDRTPKIPQQSVERDINALIPVLSFKTGTEKTSFTVQDLIRKAEVLGVSQNQAEWLYSQGNNYAPPIDFDKFTNFFNYCWVAQALPNTPEHAWNPTLAPEFYTIAPPQASDLDKLNVVTTALSSIVLTGTGFFTQTWVVEFSDAENFTVTATGAGINPSEAVQSHTLPVIVNNESSSYTVNFLVSGLGEPLITFKIVRDPIYDGSGNIAGSESFAAGDSFTVSAPFISSAYNVTPNQVSPGVKGKITAINSLDTYQTVNGVTLKENDRILVTMNGNDNGIYVVKPGTFVRATDYSGSTMVAGARVFDRTHLVTYVSTAANTWNVDPSTISNTNDWQESNYWMHRDAAAAAGIDVSRTIQATRPVIEFKADVVLNTHYTGNLPSGTGTEYQQRKTEFNQVPLFDLYRYDGTHASKVSPIFYYVEDPTEAIDPVLQRRVKHASNESGDFVFAHGLLEGESLLFYKTRAGTLKSIWHPGYSSAQVVQQNFSGDGTGVFTVATVSPFTAQQIWTLTATSALTFSITGSKNKSMPAPYDVVTVGTPYNNGLVSISITQGSTPFTVGDTFTFSVGNFETTRYVYRDSDDAVYDLFGGPDADTDGVGAWQVPRMFYNNVAASNGDEVPEGTLYSHFRGVLLNQLPGGTEDRAFGGSIKLWSEQQNLLASLLMQRDMTPTSMVDFAQRQYETALNSITDIYLKEIISYMGSAGAVLSTDEVSALVDYLLTIRSKDDDVRTVLYDSTAGVIGFPATLPMLGVSPLAIPGEVFDNELGVELFRHHDGHLSPLFAYTQDFKDRLISPGMMVKRSDGAVTPAIGSYTTTPPTQPYKGEIWLYPTATAQQFRVYDVLSDAFIAPTATDIGDFWYNRSIDTLYVWDGSLWQSEPNVLAPWKVVDPAEVLNSVVLEIEQRLYYGVNELQRTYFSDADIQNWSTGSLSVQLERELATWAAANGYDPHAPDYDSTNAFTWNYSSLGMPARWYKALQAHQVSAGALATSRPNLEPWKLMNNTAKPSTWDAQYQATVTPDMVTTANGYITGPSVRAVVFSAAGTSTPLVGLPIVDGVQLMPGDKLLLASEMAPVNNGVWIVGSGTWVRDSVSLAQKLVVSVVNGDTYSGTQWVLAANAVPNIDPVMFDLVKYWKMSMWTDIQTMHPTLKLSVDTIRDSLLPPYVNAALPYGVNALTNTMPSTPSAPYEFGEGSPVETIWAKSVEFRYSLARALFREDPLAFLGHCWGYNWVEVDGILYDGADVTVPGHYRFRLHGDAVSTVTRKQPFTIESGGFITGTSDVDITFTYNGYTNTRGQAFSITKADGTEVATIVEGNLVSFSGGGVSGHFVRIEDEGIPFRVGDSFHVTASANGANLSVTFTPTSYHKFLGFGQIFTQGLRANSVDTRQGYATQAYKGWDVNLGYRAGGLVSTDDLRVFTDSETIPESAYELRFKKSQFAKDMWVQGLRVSVVQMGASKVTSSGNVPTSDASDWVFRVEGYNPRHLGIEYYTLDTNDEYMSFNALSSAHTPLEWRHYTEKTSVVNAQLPLTFTGLQPLVDFLFGYSDKLEDDGWRFQDEAANNTDAETGRIRNWQLEIEKLIDRVYAGIELGQGHVVVPFMDRVWVQQDTGLLSEYFDSALFDVTGHPGVFDTLGAKINTEDLTVLRARELSMIMAEVPMFSVHAQIDEYEHLFVFSNMTSPSTEEGLIYDPFSGARIVTVKLNGRRQAAKTLRPEFGGHYLVGDEVKRNLQSSTDKVAQYYDADHVFEDKLSTRHALALLGFSPKQYMTDLDLNDSTQFNFWRGLVQMKGTNSSIDAFLNNDRFYDAKLDEYWAYKVAEYGDSRSKIFPELKLTVEDTIQQFTKLQFVPTGEKHGSLESVGFIPISSDDEDRWFTLDDLDTMESTDPTFEAVIVGQYVRTFQADEVPTQIKLPFVADEIDYAHTDSQGDFVQDDSSALVRLNITTLLVKKAGTVEVIGYGPAAPKFNPVKLFNYAAGELIEEIPIWHPAAGQHTPTALKGVNVISDLDPARYNVSTLVAGNANYDPLRIWGAKELGRVWFDTTNLDYVPYYDKIIYSDIDGRLSRWGTLADYATVDIVEWVESTVPPSEYDDQSAQDAGDADLDPYTKADGQVYGAKTYSRTRTWAARPIAWSYVPTAQAAGHPSFSARRDQDLFIGQDGLAYLEGSTFADRKIVAGMRLGGWEVTSTDAAGNAIDWKPVSEYIVNNDFKKRFVFPSGQASNVSMSMSTHTEIVGELTFTVQQSITPILNTDGVQVAEDISWYIVATGEYNDDTNTTPQDVVLIRTDRDGVFSLLTNQSFTYELGTFGLALTVALTAGTYDTSNVAQNPAYMLATLSGTQLFDAVTVEALIPGTDSHFSNDTDGFMGWTAWSVPTQEALDTDAKSPNSALKPYIGDYVSITPTIEQIQDAATGNDLVLNNGTVIARYATGWENWEEVKSTQICRTAEDTGQLVIDLGTLTTIDQISVYINGVAQLTGTYSIENTNLTISSVAAGSEAVVIIRAYSPSEDELAFDPDSEDNLLIQQQYKIDYQYVALPVRDSDGQISSTKYYFWVKNRSTAARKKDMSVKGITQLVTSGPSQYLTFQGLDGETLPPQEN